MKDQTYIKEIKRWKLFRHLTEDIQCQLLNTAIALTNIPKGVLMLHESKEVMAMRLGEINMENTEENRRKYRSLILSTKLNQYISGIVLNEEGLYQKDDNGILLVDLIRDQGIIPGFRGDSGIEKLYGIHGDIITEGLDSLDEKCKKYKEDGCRFSIWRSIFTITEENPTVYGIKYNADACAKFANICQTNGIVPLIGIEISPEGKHSLKDCKKALHKILNEIFTSLYENKVYLEGTIIQSTVVGPGLEGEQCKAADVADATLEVFSQTILTSTMGIQILSGGIAEEDATANLNELFHCNKHRKPWPITFAYGRALQMSFLFAWNGKNENETIAQKQLKIRANALSKATVGKYMPLLNKAVASHKTSIHFTDIKKVKS